MPVKLLLMLSFLTFIPSASLAQEVEKINAQILPTIWHSSLDASEGDKLNIYAAIQNNSGLNFSGMVLFYVDDNEIAQVPFNSSSDSLREVRTEWLATKGKHSFQAKLDANLPAGKKLISTESNKVSLSISHILTLEEIKEDATKTILALGEKIDKSAEDFALTLESLKKPVVENNNDSPKSLLSRTSPTKSNSVAQAVSENVGNALLASVFNSGIDAAGFLVEHWLWTLGGIFVLYLIFKFR